MIFLRFYKILQKKERNILQQYLPRMLISFRCQNIHFYQNKCILTPMKDILTSSKRDEHSLFALTKKFVKLLWESPDRAINIGTAAKMLGVLKRRLYDITNVLESINLITKWNINSVKWIGGEAENIFNDTKCSEIMENLKEFYNLSESNVEKENAPNTNNEGNRNPEEMLDKEIAELNERLRRNSYDKTNLQNAFVSYETLKTLCALNDKILFVVKASDETVVDYPKYEKGGYRMKISSENEKISVFFIDNRKM